MRYLVAATVGFALVALTSAVHAEEIHTLTDPSNFQNPGKDELPALAGPGNYWRADATLDDTPPDAEQHLIYVQGGQPGTTPDADAGENPELLWDDVKTSSDNGGARPDREVTVADIKSLSWTTKTQASESNDWFVDVFTKTSDPKKTSPASVTWYDRNFDFTASPVNSTEQAQVDDDGWNTWEADSNDVEDPNTIDVSFFNNDDGVGGEKFTLDGADGSAEDDGLPTDADEAPIKWVAIGTNSEATDFSGKLDEFQITYQTSSMTSSATTRVNFAPVPTSAWGGLVLLGLLAVGAMMRRWKAARLDA